MKNVNHFIIINTYNNIRACKTKIIKMNIIRILCLFKYLDTSNSYNLVVYFEIIYLKRLTLILCLF